MHRSAARFKRLRDPGAELCKELVVRLQLLSPCRLVDASELLVARAFQLLQPGPLQIVVARDHAEGGFRAGATTCATVNDPLQHAHVLRKAWPDVFASRILAKPVDAKDARRMSNSLAHAQPVREIVSHVIAAKRDHGHRIAPHDADLAGDRCGRFRAKRRAHVDTFLPRLRFDDQRHRRGAAPAEDEGRDRHALWVFPQWVHGWALNRRDCETSVGMCGRPAATWRPVLALPIYEAWRRLAR